MFSKNKPRVGVIDSGWDRRVADNRVLQGVSMVGDEGGALHEPSTDDQDRIGHGTFCTDILLQSGADVEIVPIRVFGDSPLTSPEVVIAALDWAVASRLSLVNLSVATVRKDFAADLYAVCDRAKAAGVIIVAAASNSRNGELVYPAAFDNVIGVQHLNLRDPWKIVYEETEGADCSVHAKLRYGRGLNGVRTRSTGTSFATPVVSGVIAGLIARHGSLDLDSVREKLREGYSSSRQKDLESA